MGASRLHGTYARRHEIRRHKCTRSAHDLTTDQVAMLFNNNHNNNCLSLSLSLSPNYRYERAEW